MTESLKSSVRRKRRITVALLVLLPGGLAWWYCTRVDQRFVGKWQVITEENGRQIVTNEVLHYFPNGDCVQYFDGRRTQPVMRWSTPGNEFVLDWNPNDILSLARRFANDLWTRFEGGTVIRTSVVRFTVLNVTSDELTLQHTSDDGGVHIVRNRRVVE